MSSSPIVLDPLVIPRIIGPNILDVGCGYGKWGFLSKTHSWLFNCQKPFVVGVDLYLPHLIALKSQTIYDGLVATTGAALPFADSIFDTVLAIELIEHLTEGDGQKLLMEIERVARRRVIISTPAFPDYRDGHQTLHGFNPHEAHVSYWSRREFSKRGYRVYGVGLRWGPSRLRQVIHSVSVALPFLGEQVLAVKDIVKGHV